MNFIYPLQSKETEKRVSKTKFIYLGLVLLFAFLFLAVFSVKVNAAGTTSIDVEGSYYDKDDNGNENHVGKVIEIGQYNLAFIQGNGNDNEVAIRFTINNFPSNITSFLIVESGYSHSNPNSSDLDLYSLESGVWTPSVNNNPQVCETEGEETICENKYSVNGSVEFFENEDGSVKTNVVYRLRKGSYGLKFLTVFFYEGNVISATPASSIDVFYVISQPIDTVSQGTNCTVKNDTICTDYINDDSNPTRVAQSLSIYLPETVAFTFDAISDEELTTEMLNSYGVTEFKKIGSIFSINYFIEDAEGGTTILSSDQTTDNLSGIQNLRSYLYNKFQLFYENTDTLGVTTTLITDSEGLYKNGDYLNTFKINEISYLQMKVDATGSYFFYLVDIFGNVKEIRQDVTDVKNRTIKTVVVKGNADNVAGYGATENFTNESVSVSLTMTAQTVIELGSCLNNRCAEITPLNANNVKQIKYWRVNVVIDGDDDKDAYQVDIGEDATNNIDYANESHAYNSEFFYIVCNQSYSNSCPTGTVVQNYSSSKKYDLDGAGFYSFESNTLVMYVALSGRYRFYIEDIYGNNTWGQGNDLAVEEYRNPRVEIYGIDKTGAEVTFNHDGTIQVGSETLTKFSMGTYEYYIGILQGKNEQGNFVYDARVTDEEKAASETIAGYIENGIYYPYNLNDGRNEDISFTNDLAVLLSKLTISDKIYYYGKEAIVYADYYVYGDRESADRYSGAKTDNSILNIKSNIYSNSNGFSIVEAWKNNNENEVTLKVEYYHYDGINRVCEQLGGNYASKSELECVNYYLDHGVDFIAKFIVKDAVGNESSGKVYVDVEDTTPAGFASNLDESGNVDNTKSISRTNIGSECRMEIGSEIGYGKGQTKLVLLECYNIVKDDQGVKSYLLEDNVYSSEQDDGLSYYNRVNNNSHIKLYVKNDNDEWIDLEVNKFIPNRTGYYDLKIEVLDYGEDDSTVLTVYLSYYVDKRIVLVTPKENSKVYGESDPAKLDYCVSVDVGNNYEIRFSDNPYSDPTIYSQIYCTDGDISNKSAILFRNNNSDFSGSLSRLESIYYNEKYGNKLDEETYVENNYVGTYNIVLGTLNIVDKDTGEQDPDYIVKIDPRNRTETKHDNGAASPSTNKIQQADYYDDDKWDAQSDINFTIKQKVIVVTANGGEKNYGDRDTNYSAYDSDNISDSTKAYLNGFTVEGLINDGVQYNDTTSVILGVLRRIVGEDVGVYKIYDYRGICTGQYANPNFPIIGDEASCTDTDLELVNYMYVVYDSIAPGLDLSDTTVLSNNTNYTKGILNLSPDYIASRALYVQTNEKTIGKTLNTTSDNRNNNFTNYVIRYVDAEYTIKPVELVIQPAPGQRREYNYTNIMQPDPWEIILYGLKDENIKVEDNGSTETIVEFGGFTATADAYTTIKKDDANPSIASLPANKSEDRDDWLLVRGSETLTGLKTNESYNLLRSTASGSFAGSAKLIRESEGVNTGGWYRYKSLGNDANISGVQSSSEYYSKIAVITNSNNHCSYDSTGHVATVNGENPCKNYNLVFDDYYTNEDGYTYATKSEAYSDSDFIYKSNGKKCTELDPDLPCDESDKYNIQFEIYRREIILEFNSAISTIKETSTNNFDIVYGKRYNYYKTNLFDIDFYTGKTFVYPEGYLFLCYQNNDEGTEAEKYDPNDATKPGCTSAGNYGLTQGDTWKNIGLNFKLHDAVSVVTNGYYGEDDKAIPAGAYYVYADINEDQKKNYNFKYLGGALTIKSKSVNVVITSYTKEYGEAYYSAYGSGDDYGNFTVFGTEYCFADGLFANSNDALVSLGEGLYCNGESEDTSNTIKNVYGFYIEGLDKKDTIVGNFIGRPNRNRSATSGNASEDVNGIQDNVGVYTLSKGTISTIRNNGFKACTEQVLKGTINDCVLQADSATGESYKLINNYVIKGETRIYKYDMHSGDIVTENTIIANPDLDEGNPIIKEGNLFITPAMITIKVTTLQTKMYGCAYNTFSNSIGMISYDYGTGYSCEEGDGDYYDLGYQYVVYGDKDYQLAQSNSYFTTYESTDKKTYTVSGIPGSTTFRPSFTEGMLGIKGYALNSYGTLYRVEDTTANRTQVLNYTYSSLAGAAQVKVNGMKGYQGQTVGSYILTIGNVDVTNNGAFTGVRNTCDINNMPITGEGGIECKNYVVEYYGTKVYNLNQTNSNQDVQQVYKNENGSFPGELIFTIEKRTTYVYTHYDQKIYGEPDQNVSYKCGDYNMDGYIDELDNVNSVNGDVYYGFCTQEQVDLNKDTDEANNYVVNYGLTRYYTKYNSLAKAPWSSSGVNDVQTDILEGKISREGMNGSGSCPGDNDIKGFYKYVYQYNCNGETGVKLTTYGDTNYITNFYESGLAVDENGKVENDNGTTYVDADGNPIMFEIVLRKIQVAFVSFEKTYGEADNVEYYDILVCAPGDEFDFENMRCITTADSETNHGLSAIHKFEYTEKDTDNYDVLKQEAFKEAFVVRYMRVLGENVSCGTRQTSSYINGWFFGENMDISEDGTRYDFTLNCAKVNESDSNTSYETLAYIDQSNSDKLGYNYQVSYITGYVSIKQRKIEVTPLAEQGFVYGDYHNTLIPAIKYTTMLSSSETGLNSTYGLVNGGDSGEGVCLKNIDYYNNTDGTCFYINDREDEYNELTMASISSYNSGLSDASTGLANSIIKNYVFGDIYNDTNIYSDNGSTRSALDRVFVPSSGSEIINQRYNRSVGQYIIVKGDLNDKSGNYDISIKSGVVYTIKAAEILITPQAIVYEGTSQNNQYKIYGEQDKELTFDVETTYIVTQTHYAKFNENIIKVAPLSGTAIAGDSLDRYIYNENSGVYEINNVSGVYIKLNKGDTVYLNGFAYDENGGDAGKNYGMNKIGNKSPTESAIDQSTVTGSMYYDVAFKDLPETIGTNADKTLSYLSTAPVSRILLGYLYVEGSNGETHMQAAGTYKIANGLKVAVNELGNNNYSMSFTENIPFTIIPRPVGVQIIDVTKIYGRATDNISCDTSVVYNCSADSGILDSSSNGFLKNNFIIEYFSDASRLSSILGNNASLYNQNSKFANGLVPAEQNVYSAYELSPNVGENKNSEHLGIYVSRDEKNKDNTNCLYDGDKFGFCEDVGEYYLRFYGYNNSTDSIAKDSYATIYKPTYSYGGIEDSIKGYYYNSYWGYNPNYFAIVVESDPDKNDQTVESVISNPFADTIVGTNRENSALEKLLKPSGTLKITKKEAIIYVNTTYFEEHNEIYYVEQNTNPPSLPLISNYHNLKYEDFITGGEARKEAVYSYLTYGSVIWGYHNSQVRTGDKLAGELAYCNVILEFSQYNLLLTNGVKDDYNCSSGLKYESDKNSVNTNSTGYVPIVRDSSKLSIVNQNSEDANKDYETTNYSITFYPGALRIDQDDTAPVVTVNRSDVYIEANAVGDYIYECVGMKGSTTYENCLSAGEGHLGYTVVGKTELVEGDPILKWLNDSSNYALIVKGELPIVNNCGGTIACTSSAYFQTQYGKGKTGFKENSIVSGEENTYVAPFTLQKSDYISSSGPSSLQSLIITLVDWFGVTAYDQGEVRNGVALNKTFDKYWYLIIEQEGTNGDFAINKVGNYRVHFYVMDNAGNVSEGDMSPSGYYYINNDFRYNKLADGTYEPTTGGNYLKINGLYYELKNDSIYELDAMESFDSGLYKKVDGSLIADLNGYYLKIEDSDGEPSNIGILHIIDTTKPVVGTLNLYNGRVVCASNLDCTQEANWKVENETYVPINTLLRYNGDGTINVNGGYVNLGTGDLVELNSLTRYYLADDGTYKEDAIQGKYIKIAANSSAEALKHYSWSNSSTGIYLTITGGSDNSYTVTKFENNEADTSQWRYYYSRDGGYTWFLYSRNGTTSLLALDDDGAREIMIKAVDSGVKISNTPTASNPDYIVSFYGEGSSHNVEKNDIVVYAFTDSSNYDLWLDAVPDYTTISSEQKASIEEERQKKLLNVGWNVSDWAQNDSQMAESLSLALYGKSASQNNNYAYYRDRKTAYLDRGKPVISFGAGNGEKLYLYEYGCETLCTKGYTEYYAGAVDAYVSNARDSKKKGFDLNVSTFVNHIIYSQSDNDGYQGSYENISEEDLSVGALFSGLSNNAYSMSGDGTGYDIRNVNKEERKYIIYEAYDENGSSVIKTYDLSALIPTTNDPKIEDEITAYNSAEEEIYKVIKHELGEDFNPGKDITYTIVYSVMDKAGNESVYIARGVIFAKLVPDLAITSNLYALENVEENTYQINVNQGDSVDDVISSLSLTADNNSQYITQTVYYNGELLMENKRYNSSIAKEFNTNSPGVYEITYSLNYMYYNDNGQSEMISAEPIKLIINVDSIAPVVNSSNRISNYSNIILIIGLLSGLLFICLVGLINKKKF